MKRGQYHQLLAIRFLQFRVVICQCLREYTGRRFAVILLSFPSQTISKTLNPFRPAARSCFYRRFIQHESWRSWCVLFSQWGGTSVRTNLSPPFWRGLGLKLQLFDRYFSTYSNIMRVNAREIHKTYLLRNRTTCRDTFPGHKYCIHPRRSMNTIETEDHRCYLVWETVYTFIHGKENNFTNS